jgi:hypothetical protein
MGTPLLAAIVRRLDATRPASLALLGRLVATYPARGEVIQALARAVADRRNSDNRRLGATLVLTQYIGLPPVDDFISTLKRPEHTIATALAFALAERAPDAGSQRDYVAALISQPLDLLYGVVGALATTPGEGAIDALRLLALQPDADLMQGSIEALASRPSPAARRALAMLEPNVPSELAQAVARLLRKQSFSGLKAGLLDPVDGACRAYLTPMDGQGRRILRFEAPRSPGETATACGARRGYGRACRRIAPCRRHGLDRRDPLARCDARCSPRQRLAPCAGCRRSSVG